MQLFKFKLDTDKYVTHPTDPRFSYKGYLAVVLADSEEEARERLRDYAQENGLDARWVDCVPHAICLQVTKPSTVCWVEV